MKKLAMLSCVLSGCFTIAHSQNPVPNSGFETWIDYGGYYEDPQSWGTVNQFTWPFGGNSPFTVKKDSNSHDGALAVKLVTIGHNNQIFPAVMCTGSMSFSNFSCTGGFPINTAYANFSGYFKYSPAETDTCVMFAMLTKWNAVDNKRDTVAVSTFYAGSTPDYTFFSDSFNYHIAEIPDSAQVVLSTTKKPLGAPLGSILLIDDISFANAVGIGDLNKIGALIFPNPVNRSLQVQLPNQDLHAELFISDVCGKEVARIPLKQLQNHISTAQFEEGLYIYNILSGQKTIGAGTLVVKH